MSAKRVAKPTKTFAVRYHPADPNPSVSYITEQDGNNPRDAVGRLANDFASTAKMREHPLWEFHCAEITLRNDNYTDETTGEFHYHITTGEFSAFYAAVEDGTAEILDD